MSQEDNPLSFHTVSAAAQSVSPEVRRAHAVSAAMELIADKLRSPGGGDIDAELQKLNEYANRIQEALRHARPAENLDSD